MSETSTTVLKLGGSVLRSEADLPLAVHEIYRHWRKGERVLAVVSAFGGTTDALIDRAKNIDNNPNPEALATLLLTGEATSAAMLGLALQRAGVPAKILTPEQVGIMTDGDPLDATPVSANIDRLRSELDKAVVVVSGFAGVRSYGDLTLLGRGGTDYTALFLAAQLGAKCRLLKDVDGMYESNPADVGTHPRKFSHATYETTLRVAGELVQPKAVKFARDHDLNFEIAALGAAAGTKIGGYEDIYYKMSGSGRSPVQVALLGCGTVGGGVYKSLSALPRDFEIVGVVNLDPAKAFAAGIDAHHRTRDAMKLIESDCDVVIELIGGLEPARTLIVHALTLGRHVITANKALLAEDGFGLDSLAQRSGVTLRYSAAVGGALPALEAVALATRSSRPISIKGIINGTSNFICDQLADGNSFEAALELAQKNGFAEADPTLDLDGTDAAQKLILLARACFGVNLPLNMVERTGVRGITAAQVEEARLNGRSYRLIAECRKTPNGIRAVVSPQQVPLNDPFASIKGAQNCLLIETENGTRRFVKGAGAGRYPTTEAVLADLFDARTLITEKQAIPFIPPIGTAGEARRANA